MHCILHWEKCKHKRFIQTLPSVRIYKNNCFEKKTMMIYNGNNSPQFQFVTSNLKYDLSVFFGIVTYIEMSPTMRYVAVAGFVLQLKISPWELQLERFC